MSFQSSSFPIFHRYKFLQLSSSYICSSSERVIKFLSQYRDSIHCFYRRLSGRKKRSVQSLIAVFFPEDMTGRVVVVTGASSGIGEQIAYQYAQKGAKLVLVARREHSLIEVAEKAKEYGSPDVLVSPADVAKADDCRRFIEDTINRFGRLDHLVNNAGIASLCMLEEATEITNFTPVMDVNFWGSVYPTYFAIPHLKSSGGRIVVTSSAAGWVAMPRMSFYNASKAAGITFYETLRSEFGSDIGITIATPGWIESEMTKGKFITKEGVTQVDQELRDVQIGLTPVVGAEECAKSIVDAACRGDRYVTEPTWFRVLYLMRVFAPEFMEWCFREFYLSGSGESELEAPSKKMLDMTGAKNMLYPSSIQIDDVKED